MMSIIVALRPAMGKEALRPLREEVPAEPGVVAPSTYTKKWNWAVAAAQGGVCRRQWSSTSSQFRTEGFIPTGQPFLEAALV